MSLEQTMTQNLPPLALKVEPQLLLTLLVALLFLILFVIGIFTVWSRTRHLCRQGQELDDQKWGKELVRKMTKVIEKSDKTP
jgi:hypothetical protein